VPQIGAFQETPSWIQHVDRLADLETPTPNDLLKMEAARSTFENMMREVPWDDEDLRRTILDLMRAAASPDKYGALPISISEILYHREVVGSEEFAQKRYEAVSEILGDPFRPVAFDPRWRTEHAVGIAATMYDERDFRAMPILADALEEAGCDSADMLTHCREPGVHVRGCWVVDLVLGKG
jgi:hypothetical protein